MILGKCSCGCNEDIPIRSTHKTLQRFKRGHNRQGLKADPAEYDNRRGANHGMWKGGRIGHSSGYIQIYKPDHPQCNHLGYVFEHRLVWEQQNNANLLKFAIVHHLNENKQDNRIENLLPMLRIKHRSYHRRKSP